MRSKMCEISYAHCHWLLRSRPSPSWRRFSLPCIPARRTGQGHRDRPGARHRRRPVHDDRRYRSVDRRSWQNRDNPVLLLLHGGPGIALSPMPRDFLFSWTRDFTIVLWDQRGAGKTFGRSGPVAAEVTKDRMAQDGIEVAEFIRTRLGKSKIAIVAVSWGTAIGVRMALARPDLFFALCRLWPKRESGEVSACRVRATAGRGARRETIARRLRNSRLTVRRRTIQSRRQPCTPNGRIAMSLDNCRMAA